MKFNNMTIFEPTEDILGFVKFLNSYDDLEKCEMHPFESSEGELKFVCLSANFKRGDNSYLYTVQVMFNEKGEYWAGNTFVNGEMTHFSSKLSLNDLKNKIKSEMMLVEIIN